MDFKKYLLFLPSLIFYSFTHAQDSEQIANWISVHPDVYIISSDNYSTISNSFRDKIKDKVIVFEGQITLADLQKYEDNAVNLEESANTTIVFSGFAESQEAKEWMAAHPEVTIVSRSHFNSLNSNQQAVHINQRSMILIGEILTAQDILNY